MTHSPTGETPKAADATFEAGARKMSEAVKSRAPEAFFANADDPLHAAFQAKAAIHSGPGGMPLIGEAARRTFESLLDRPRTGKTLAYIHVPFCETRCLYCMFYQNPFKEEAVHEYAKRLVGELQRNADRAAQNSAPVHAVYFGGGTPTAFAPDDLRIVLKALHDYLPLANDCEITLEGRIHNFSDAKMEAALEGGVNRFSLGVQTFNTQVRQSVQRVDDRDTIIERLNKLCSYDNSAVVLDLIYGFPGQTMEVWEDDLRTAASLPLDGIDCYQLNVFEKSPLARYIANGKLPPAADKRLKADLFARSVEYLTEQNWRRLSNNHWGANTRERNIYNALGKSACDCLAFGCGAGGRLFGYSYMMERKLAEYYSVLEQGEKPACFLMAPKANWHLLRTISADMESGAINLKRISRAFGDVDLEGMAAPILTQWCEAGMLVKRGDWYLQTVAGQYWHVTLAQLLMNWVEPMLPGAQPPRRFDMGSPDAMKAMTSAKPLTLADVALMLAKIPSGVRDMARMMPRAMLVKAIHDMPAEKLAHMGGGVNRDEVLKLLEGLSPSELSNLLKNPEQVAAKATEQKASAHPHLG
ncbi:heme anaerobic degradation radical SAM methyltransferase ChuW/HutW [Sutterella sp.]|uniref:heme anaerobic degradation radical SAM methyltransferase ChuW/HutW n=1 Tax=Sutterella sp. TaxID=1981025 RepID=UPI0026DEB50D|nr:heme anaerobic degradation radical SAM methyltransferase ChuW/HutW [Sutterella sp.]MDO5532244.1 heme anaerobic degradation radical SAM methyltransferase ChuW/HutW [Sutterella sp.]